MVGELLDGVTRRARILVCGSRRWADVGTIRLELAAAWTELATTAGAPVLVHGGCPRGADRIADILWRRWGGQVETHPADWDRYGRGAGMRRNADMVAAGADRVLGPEAVDGFESGGGCFGEWGEHLHDAMPELTVHDLAAALAQTSELLEQAVTTARGRDVPVSWDRIGRAAGMSRQAAWERWGRLTP